MLILFYVLKLFSYRRLDKGSDQKTFFFLYLYLFHINSAAIFYNKWLLYYMFKLLYNILASYIDLFSDDKSSVVSPSNRLNCEESATAIAVNSLNRRG